ncbi:MAG: metalloregulator ArsR/SmtB family transcription factor [Thermoanaerobaculia bacterium]|nr:metalloregulator ArsR/SmtB family transcription factor [Thermoanaerobaculia bacterium]
MSTIAGREPDPSRRQLDRFFKALSDETRREILRLLERREMAVGQIVDQFDLSQPTISRHLSVLKQAELVVDERRGQRVIYHLRENALASGVVGYFGSFRQCRPQLSLLQQRDEPGTRGVGTFKTH